jgi:hypothetical protein
VADERPSVASPETNGSSRHKRPREPSDSDDTFAVEAAPVAVDRAASCSGAADSKFAKLRRIMAAARGII